MAIRRNIASLSEAERTRYVTGVREMKRRGLYNVYVNDHATAALHRGPAFYPWHREFILRFENDLKLVLGDPDYGLPYWDWAADAALPDPRTALVWNNNFMGPNGNPANGGVVEDGPFGTNVTGPDRWRTVPGGIFTGTDLIRQMQVDTPSLPGQTTVGGVVGVNEVLALGAYDAAPFNQATPPGTFRNQGEGWSPAGPAGAQQHNRVHVWVGGHMAQVPQAPNDPVFFLHHCNVDRIWARWQLCSPTPDYLPVTGGPTNHNIDDPMPPWNARGETRTPRMLLDHIALGFSYDTETPSTQTITLRRTTGDRFVSDKVIEVTSPCESRAETATTLFVPGRPGGRIRAQMSTMSDEVPVNR
jgi:tyrosinase